MTSYKNNLVLKSSVNVGRNSTSKTCQESLFCGCFYMQNQLGSQNKFIHLAMGETRANEEGLEQNQNNDSEVIKLVVKDLGHPLSLSLPSRNV